MNLLKSAWILLLVSLATILNAQPKKNLIEIAVTPNHTNWTYNLGEVPVFNIQVLQNGQPLSNSKINYKIGLEQLPAALEKELEIKE
jgi:cephalosporin-C deacetylase